MCPWVHLLQIARMYYINEKDEIDEKKHNKTSENAIKKNQDRKTG